MKKLKTTQSLAYCAGAALGVALYILAAFIFAQSLSNDKASLPFALFVLVVLLMAVSLFYSAIGLLMKCGSLFNAVIAAALQIFVGGGALMNILRSEYMPDDNIKLVYYCLAAFAPILFGAVVLVCTVTVKIVKIIKKK